MQAFEIAQRGNFVVVVFRVEPAIEIAYPTAKVVHNPLDTMEGSVHDTGLEMA